MVLGVYNYNYTGGVPLHIMEVVNCPAEGTPERNQAFQVKLYFIGGSESYLQLPYRKLLTWMGCWI